MSDQSLRERLMRVVWWLDWFPSPVPWRYPVKAAPSAAVLLGIKEKNNG